MRNSRSRFLAVLLAGAVLTFAISTVVPLPARACSCAAPSDIRAWVDESQAAFVGTLVDRRDGLEGQLGSESIFVFQVEEWVKGDAGEVIEVRSASDGAACGFEFWDEDMRIGAILHEENGELHGSLCAQIDPDVLLAAIAEPTPSSTGIGHLLAANGFTSTRLTVLDEKGHHVTDLQLPGADRFSGTQHLDVCPDGHRLVQTTSTQIVVWDLLRLELVDTHDIPDHETGWWPADVACRAADGSSIWMVQASEVSSRLVEIAPEPEVIRDLPGSTGAIGVGFIVSQLNFEGDAILLDLETGEELRLTETPPDALHGVYPAPHPSRPIVAVVETRFSTGEEVDASLTVFDRSGTRIDSFDIPWETYAPTWLDGDRVAVTAYDWTGDVERSIGYVFNLTTGAMAEIEEWQTTYAVADGDKAYTVEGGTIVQTALDTGSSEPFVTLASQSAGPLVVLDHSEPVTTTTSEPEVEPSTTTATVPPLVAPELGSDARDTGYIQWVAGFAILLFLGILAWLGMHKPKGAE